MKRKLLEKMIRFGLVLLVLSSLYFSINIWINPMKEDQLLIPEQSSTTVAVNERLASDVFLPLRLIRVDGYNVEMNASENLIANVQNEVTKGSYGRLEKRTFGTEGEFTQYISMEQGFELLYEGEFLLSEYLNIYALDIDITGVDAVDKVMFTYLQVDLEQQKIRFLDFVHNALYEAPVDINVKNVRNLMNNVEMQYSKVTEKKVFTHNDYYYTDALKLKKYSYILATQPITKFRNAFFSNAAEIQTNEDSNDLSYISGEDRMIVDNQQRTVNFFGKLDSNTRITNSFSESFVFVKKLGTSMGNIHYFDYVNDKITYRTFVEGFPVFSDDDKGQVIVTIGEKKKNTVPLAIATSLDTIQVPIPSEAEVILENSKSVLDTIAEAGIDRSEIDSMVIGYTWQKIEETTQVVDLIPEWYIRYEGAWYSKNQLLEQVKTEVR